MSDLVEEKIVKTVQSVYSADGELLAPEDREDITEECIFFDPDLAVGRVSVSRTLAIKTYGFGGNCPVFVSVSAPYPVNEGQKQGAIKYCTNACEEEVVVARESYGKWLDKCGIDWKKIENNVK